MIQGLSATSFFDFGGVVFRFWVLGYGGVAFHLSSKMLRHEGLFQSGGFGFRGFEMLAQAPSS